MARSYIKQLMRHAQGVTLSPFEKEATRVQVSEFMRAHPVREGIAVRHIYQRSDNAYSFLLSLSHKPMPVIIILVVLGLSGGTFVAAEQSLPGDALYPVKVRVEEARALLSVQPREDAVWAVERAGRRLQEAEQLATSGKLEAELQSILEQNFKAHAERVAEKIEKLEEKGEAQTAVDIASQFEVSLLAHKAILERIENREDVKVGDVVDDALSKTIETRAEVEGKLSDTIDEDMKTVVFGKLEAAEHKIAEVEKFLQNKKQGMNAQTLIEAEAKLKVARDLQAQAQVKIEAGAYVDAFPLLQQAMRTAQEAKALIQVELKLKGTIKLNVREVLQ